jgi:predicted RNA-binding Zn-ribbon protein involved in translation (DUF1610 family)
MGCETVPQKVICEKCGFVLYAGTELKPPDEIIQMHEGKCPECGNEISFIPKKVEVTAANDAPRRR